MDGIFVNPHTKPSNSLSAFAFVTKLTPIVTRKHVDQAKIAIQKFCAIVEGNECQTPNIPPLPSASVKLCVNHAASVPASKPLNAPCPVVRRQNIPSKNVANSGAFTNPKTSWSKSIMLLYCCAKNAVAIDSAIPTTVVIFATIR